LDANIMIKQDTDEWVSKPRGGKVIWLETCLKAVVRLRAYTFLDTVKNFQFLSCSG
jgi:hypothetical protein